MNRSGGMSLPPGMMARPSDPFTNAGGGAGGGSPFIPRAGGGGMPPPPPISAPRGKAGFAPIGWEGYFDESRDVVLNSGDQFRLYEAGPAGAPVILCLHGGGYTGLTWGLVAQRLKDKYRVVAMDLRGHGASKTSDDMDLSHQALTGDVADVWERT
eukprot:CAMPEP_0182869002 /NCGR_PEP_ID=MMETSP0034_2-20130328/9658_1 /TAXON_ID=156128 /ORGANISM="Nephroselmis pyriformis, Strain CCMP717" /LENGTH=155 /DNA_ID=CAMNT_0025001437 /DNA_START=390 /DNA_END=854 /DNA_ORIENTATION=+